MPQSKHKNGTILSLYSEHLGSVICGQPASALTFLQDLLELRLNLPAGPLLQRRVTHGA